MSFADQLPLEKRVDGALIGPFVGAYIDLLLGGVCMHLVAKYLRTGGRPPVERRVVYVACGIAVVNSIVHIHQILDVALMNLYNADRVVRFGASQEIDTWNFQCTFLLNGLVLALVQSVYAYRVIKLAGDRLCMKIGLTCLIVVGVAANAGPTAVSFGVPKPQDVVDVKEQIETYRLLNKYKPVIMMMYVMNMIVDFVVCAITMITLRRSMNKATTRTAKFLRQYAILCVEGMALPFLASIAAMIMHNAGPAQSSIDVSAIWPMHKLALVSLFCLLLNRDTFREKLHGAVDLSFELCSPIPQHTGSVRVENQVETSVFQDEYQPRSTANRPVRY